MTIVHDPGAGEIPNSKNPMSTPTPTPSPSPTPTPTPPYDIQSESDLVPAPPSEIPSTSNTVNNWAAPAISILILVIFMMMVIFAFLMRDNALINTLVTTIIPLVTYVVGYWLGSSSSSQKKDVTIATQNNHLVSRLK